MKDFAILISSTSKYLLSIYHMQYVETRVKKTNKEMGHFFHQTVKKILKCYGKPATSVTLEFAF